MKPTCRICGSSQNELVSDQVSDAPEASVYKCLDCAIIFVFPIMTEAEERAFYQQEFEEYMQKRSGDDWQSPEAHFDAYKREALRRLGLVEDYLNKRDNVLEIGSSTGYFLDTLRPRVNSVTGVEPSKAYRDFANKRNIKTYPSKADIPQKQFDVIALYYVLEHLRDPVGYLQSLAPILSTVGRLLIEVPNVEDVLLTRYDIPAFPGFYWQKAHYSNFSRKTLLNVLDRAGYEADIFPVQRYDLSNHIVWMKEGVPGGSGRYNDLFTEELELEYATALRNKWVCDTLFAVAVKNE